MFSFVNSNNDKYGNNFNSANRNRNVGNNYNYHRYGPIRMEVLRQRPYVEIISRATNPTVCPISIPSFSFRSKLAMSMGLKGILREYDFKVPYISQIQIAREAKFQNNLEIRNLLTQNLPFARYLNYKGSYYLYILQRQQQEMNRYNYENNNDPDASMHSSKSPIADDDTPQCAICLDNFADGDEFGSLPCCHLFHKQCIDKWLKVRMCCPLCLSVVVPTDHGDDDEDEEDNDDEDSSRNDEDEIVVETEQGERTSITSAFETSNEESQDFIHDDNNHNNDQDHGHIDNSSISSIITYHTATESIRTRSSNHHQNTVGAINHSSSTIAALHDSTNTNHELETIYFHLAEAVWRIVGRRLGW